MSAMEIRIEYLKRNNINFETTKDNSIIIGKEVECYNKDGVYLFSFTRR